MLPGQAAASCAQTHYLTVLSVGETGLPHSDISNFLNSACTVMSRAIVHKSAGGSNGRNVSSTYNNNSSNSNSSSGSSSSSSSPASTSSSFHTISCRARQLQLQLQQQCSPGSRVCGGRCVALTNPNACGDRPAENAPGQQQPLGRPPAVPGAGVACPAGLALSRCLAALPAGSAAATRTSPPGARPLHPLSRPLPHPRQELARTMMKPGTACQVCEPHVLWGGRLPAPVMKHIAVAVDAGAVVLLMHLFSMVMSLEGVVLGQKPR